MEECACLCGLGSSRGCLCPQECQGPAETAAAAEGRAAAQGCAGNGGISSSMPPPHCSLQDLPVEMLVDIFASLPGTDLASLAQACTKFRDILHTDSIWRHAVTRSLAFLENCRNEDDRSYREVYTKMFPYRNLLCLWQLDYGYRRLLNVMVNDGLCITDWMYGPRLNTHVDGPMQFEPSFRIHLMQRKSATVEYMDDLYSFFHSRHMQIQKDRFSIRWIQRDPRQDSPTRLRVGPGLEMSQEDRQLYDRLTYRRLYLPPSHPGDLISPGLFQGKSDGFGPMIAMLSFHGKYARVTKIRGDLIWTLEVHLMHRIHLPDGETFHNFNELSHIVQEIEEQVICEQQQQQQQQQQEKRTEESEGHGWLAEPCAAQRRGVLGCTFGGVSFVLHVGVRSGDQNYPRICRMCFYGVHVDTLHGSAYPRRCPGVFILFDENHFRFIWLEMKYFILLGRVQNTFQHVEAPPQAFLEMLSNIQPGPP
uniref:F-box domain-containing protein n=1 Tax=Myotis lucifugus TaxID=59463 RepID=G1PXQ8_MYOLU